MSASEMYFPCFCPKCGWHGMSNEAEGGNPIADTGDFTEVICPKCIHAGGVEWQGSRVEIVEADAVWKVYEINDCDWWMARSLAEAKRDYAVMFNADPEQYDEARELTAEEMEELIYQEDLSDSACPTSTFAAELKRRVVKDPTSQIFATTEY